MGTSTQGGTHAGGTLLSDQLRSLPVRPPPSATRTWPAQDLARSVQRGHPPHRTMGQPTRTAPSGTAPPPRLGHGQLKIRPGQSREATVPPRRTRGGVEVARTQPLTLEVTTAQRQLGVEASKTQTRDNSRGPWVITAQTATQQGQGNTCRARHTSNWAPLGIITRKLTTADQDSKT